MGSHCPFSRLVQCSDSVQSPTLAPNACFSGNGCSADLEHENAFVTTPGILAQCWFPLGKALMIFVLLAATCSVLVSVLLKLARRHEIDVPQAITWNYLAASILCWFLLHPQLASLPPPGAPWVVLLGLAVALPALFLVLAASVRRAGIVLTDIAQRMSLLLSLIAAFLFFGESASTQKIIGLILGLIAVAGILIRPERSAADAGGRVWLVLLTVWGGLALIDVMLKCVAAAGTPFATSLQLSFSPAFAGMLVWQCLRVLRRQTRLSLRDCGAGVLLGILNFANILFYVKAHKALSTQPAVVFATMNIGVVVLGALVGVLIFKERLSRRNYAAIALAIAAIVLISTS
jgi:drug/metabolite transporter (DMT)-like permease